MPTRSADPAAAHARATRAHGRMGLMNSCLFMIFVPKTDISNSLG
jgi:hypothetical protein